MDLQPNTGRAITRPAVSPTGHGSTWSDHRGSTPTTGGWRAEIQAEPALAQKQPYKALVDADADFFAGVSRQDPEVIQLVEEAIVEQTTTTPTGSTPTRPDPSKRSPRAPEVGWAVVSMKDDWNRVFT